MLPENKTRKFLLFESALGHRLVACDDVVEVINMVALQRDPEDAQNHQYCGVFDYRGKIVPVFDFVEYDERNISNPGLFLLILQNKQKQMALIARDLADLVDIQTHDINDIDPEAGIAFEVAKVDEQLIRIVNAARFMS